VQTREQDPQAFGGAGTRIDWYPQGFVSDVVLSGVHQWVGHYKPVPSTGASFRLLAGPRTMEVRFGFPDRDSAVLWLTSPARRDDEILGPGRVSGLPQVAAS
jgi:hypothetical protein